MHIPKLDFLHFGVKVGYAGSQVKALVVIYKCLRDRSPGIIMGMTSFLCARPSFPYARPSLSYVRPSFLYARRSLSYARRSHSVKHDLLEGLPAIVYGYFIRGFWTRVQKARYCILFTGRVVMSAPSSNYFTFRYLSSFSLFQPICQHDFYLL